MDSQSLQALAHNVGTSDAPKRAEVIIIGGGPAGLASAYELTKHGVGCIVLEQDPVVGGLARTAEHNGFLFDLGGHRFFTKVKLIHRVWEEVAGSDFLKRSRLSRIYYRGKLFDYPLQPRNALANLGIFEAVRCGFSYLRAKCFPVEPESDFASWVSNRFGRRLFKIFFESYTEKVWGMKCTEIRAEWAAQRIRGLSLRSLIWNALRKPSDKPSDVQIKTLIHEFEYPRTGPGMLWTRMKRIVEERGGRVVLEAPVTRIHWGPKGVTAVEAGGVRYEGEYFVSSMPIRNLIESLSPCNPALEKTAAHFRYRDFIVVALLVNAANLFSDNWIYVHDSSVRVGRIQNYKNWSPDMVPDPSVSCLGLEYFCFSTEELWAMPDADLVALGVREVAKLGLVNPEQVMGGAVVRVPKAYPIYGENYKEALEEVRAFLARVPNLQLVGRNGMHRYNNMDHSMLTAVYAARNILGGEYDLWNVNVDAEYHEAGAVQDEEDFVPKRRSSESCPALTR